MMNSQSFLTFRLQDLIYAIEPHLVKEIFQLPELIVVPETPGDIIGVLYLRDRLIPVMHLDRRLRQPIQECCLSDRVIVIEWQDIEMGIIVNDVLDVVDLQPELLQSEPDYGRADRIHTAFVNKIVSLEESSLILLNSEALIRESESIDDFVAEAAVLTADYSESVEPIVPTLGNFFDLYCYNATASDRDIFRQRAKDLQKPLETWTTEGTFPLAVFRLGEEFFGCDLDVVREFIDLDKITPIPCCPSHIIGNINLRGEIVTLVDIRSVLQFNECEKPITQAILVQIDDINVGIVVDEIFDVLYIDRAKLNPIPSGIDADIRKYFRGMTDYENNLMSAIDLPKIFAEGNLIVA